MRASFALHREIADELGAERLGYRPMDATHDRGGRRGRRSTVPPARSPDWLDGNVAVHEVIGDTGRPPR